MSDTRKIRPERRLTNEMIDENLSFNNRLIKRIGNVKSAKLKITWQCLDINCNYMWEAAPHHIKGGSGCPKCANRIPLTNEDIDNYLLNNSRSLKRVNDILRAKDKINWECLVCKYIWLATPDDIKHGSGCPKCSQCLFISNEDMDKWIIDNNKPIKRLSDMAGMHTKISWNCLKCNYIWLAPPGPIKYRDQGCPICNVKGYNSKLIYQYLISLNISFEKEKNIKELDRNEIRTLWLDYYFPQYSLAIEYNGLQHYKPWRFSSITVDGAENNFLYQQERDEYKRQFCNKNNITLIEIDGRKYKDNKLIEYIRELVNNMTANL